MKKTLLLCAAALFSFVGRVSAGDGLVAVGANVIILPSSQYDGDIEWKAWTWVWNSQTDYGEWNTENPNYNAILGEPSDDAEDRHWYELGYNMADIEDENADTFEPIVWEEHTAPFSTDATYNGRPSYQWTSGSIMADIYVRRPFIIPQNMMLSGPVFLACGHDDAPAEYYINGELVFEVSDGWENGKYIQLTDEQKALIKLNGEENVIAFHVHQNWGGAFADCGLYTKIEGGLDMGYTTPWEGKVLFNSIGGFDHIENNQPVESRKHPWSPLYEAKEGDVYTFTLNGSTPADLLDDATTYDDYTDELGYGDLSWKEQLHFKTPIKIEKEHTYKFQVWLGADKPFTNVIVKLTDNDDDEAELYYNEVEIPEPIEGEEYEGTLVECEFSGYVPSTPGKDPATGEEIKIEHPVNNFKIAFDFGGGQDTTAVVIKDISLIDLDDEEVGEKELWIGTQFFNYFYMTKAHKTYLVWDDTIKDETGEEVGGLREAKTDEEKENAEEIEVTCEVLDAPKLTGRTETMDWTQADFDDSMWDDQMMPVGNAPYFNIDIQSEWPGGDNSNYWIRRNFELDKVNERLEYQLNVCHDDTYETYVNGHLLQKNTGWTDGKSPVQVHIPARYLNVGKNVIATYIQQNWGGKFYDCGINVTEINYDECLKAFNDALAYANTDTLLTNRMKADVKAVVDKAKIFFEENKNDAAELRAYARDSVRPKINTIFGYSSSVKTLKDTWEICRKMEDKGYWGTALDDVTAALDTCATANDINKYLNPLREARKATAMERHNEKYVGCVPEAVTMEEIGDWDMICPKYYIYNVGAKQFLGGGEAWGAHMALEYISNSMMLIQAEKDVIDEATEDIIGTEPIEGAYYIETFRPNGNIGEMDFLNWNGFVDCPLNNNGLWELIPVEGKQFVYNIAQYGQASEKNDTTYAGNVFEPGCKRYLGLRDGDNRFAPSIYVVDTDMHDPNLATNQWMFISREEMLSLIATASEENPVDLSFLINNPGYDQRWSIDDWIFFNGSVWGRNGDHPNFVLESYNTNEFNNYQELWPEEYDAALPAGTYVLEVQGYYRDGIEDAHLKKVLAGQPINQNALIFAGPEADVTVCETMPLMPIHIEANKVPGIGFTYGGMSVPGTYGGQPYSACDQASRDYFGCGLYWNQVVFTISEDDPGHVSFGIDKPYDDSYAPGDWIVMDNWRLKYYGGAEIDPDAIKGIESDEVNKTAPASKYIYNMLGQRMSKAQTGVNIVNGKKVIKQ